MQKVGVTMLNQLESAPRIFEKGVAHTKEPRDGKTIFLLALVFSCFFSTLLFANIFAETKRGHIKPAMQRTKLHDERIHVAYGKSE